MAFKFSRKKVVEFSDDDSTDYEEIAMLAKQFRNSLDLIGGLVGALILIFLRVIAKGHPSKEGEAQEREECGAFNALSVRALGMLEQNVQISRTLRVKL